MSWIDITTEMPRPGKRVLVRFLLSNGNAVITIGCYLPPKFRDASTCDDDCEEWAEEDSDGNFWWPEGWWEEVRIAEQVDRISGVTHWQQLPSVEVLP